MMAASYKALLKCRTVRFLTKHAPSEVCGACSKLYWIIGLYLVTEIDKGKTVACTGQELGIHEAVG